MGLEKINYMRKRTGMSIDELSEKSGVPKGTLSKITAGITKNPSVDNVKAIVHAMGFTLDDLDDVPQTKSNSLLTSKESSMIEKYRHLSDSGKEMVDMVLDKEYERALSSNLNNEVLAETDDETPAKVHYSLVAAYGGKEIDRINYTEEEYARIKEAEKKLVFKNKSGI